GEEHGVTRSLCPWCFHPSGGILRKRLICHSQIEYLPVQDERLARTGRRHFPLHVREPSPDVRFDDVRELYGPPSRKNPGVEQGPLPRCRFLLDDTPGREPLRERPKGLRAGTGIDVLPAMKVRADRRHVLLRGGLGGE